MRVASDTKLLRRVLQNFLTNAFRYAKGPILLGVRRRNGQLSLEVWDRGPGIPEDKRQVIFEEFKRLDSHQTRAEKGLGLGLAIADGLCRVLGHTLGCALGRARAACSPSRCRWRAAIPTPVAAPLPNNVRAALNGAQVLCVDNEDSILMGMNSLLSRWGCQVWTARNREECAGPAQRRHSPATGAWWTTTLTTVKSAPN